MVAAAKVVIDGESLTFAQIRDRDRDLFTVTVDRKKAAYKAYLAYGRFLHQVDLQIGEQQFDRLFANDGRGVHHNGRRRAVNVYTVFGLDSGEIDQARFDAIRDKFNLEAPKRNVKTVAGQPTIRNMQILAKVRAPDKADAKSGKSFVPTGTREPDDIDDVFGFAPSTPSAPGPQRQATPPTAIVSATGVSARAPGGMSFPHVRITTRHEEADGLTDSDRVRGGGDWNGPVARVATIAPHGTSESRNTSPSRVPGRSTTTLTLHAQLSLESEYRAAAMARELAGLIESGQAASSVIAEFVAFAERVGLGLKGGV